MLRKHIRGAKHHAKAEAEKFTQMYKPDYPVDVVSLIRQNNYLLYTYTEIAAEANKTFDEIKQKYGADGFTFWSGKYDNFIIAYNENQKSERIKWTLAHELGHITLGHLITGR